MDDTVLNVIKEYGAIAVILYVIWRDMLPILRDKLIPYYAERKKAQGEEEKRAAERRANWDNRVLIAFENSTAATVELRLTLSGMSTQLERHTELLDALASDVSGLYGHINLARPSRTRKREQAS